MRSPRTHRLAGALAAAALIVSGAVAGCGSPGSSAAPEWAGTITDSAGIRIVANPDVGLWSDADRWRVEVRLRIGTSAGDPDYQFGQISGIAELPDGRIVVLDQLAQHLRIYTAAGEHLRTIGGSGSGPGEFGVGAGPVLVAAGDTLLVPDIANQRVNRFAPDGTPLGSVAMELGASLPMAWQDAPGGRVVTQLRPFAPGQATDTDPVDVIVERTASGGRGDTVLVFPSGLTFGVSDQGMDLEFFAPEPVWSLRGAGVAFAVNDVYRVSVYDSTRSLERIITKPFVPRAISEADRTLLTDRMLELFEDFGMQGPQLAFLRESMGFADFYPAFAFLLAGPGGTIWVQHLQVPTELSAEERETFNPQLGFGASTWDVFDADGRFLGEVDMPERFQPLRFTGDRIYGIGRDDLDVQYAVIVDVVREAATGS